MSTFKLPKPFDKFSHLTGYNTAASDSCTSSCSPQVSPLNQAWINSPNSLMENIPKSDVLSGCVAFVDVWSWNGCDNRSRVFSEILRRMGAKIVRKFTKCEAVTHLVFKDGHKSYLQKAKTRHVKVVSCLWVERCRVTQEWEPEKDYIFDDSKYKPPKRFREMQPLDPEEEQIRSAERLRKKDSKEKKREARRAVTFLSPLAKENRKIRDDRSDHCKVLNKALASDTPYVNPSATSYRFFHPYLVAETPNENIQRKLERMKAGKPIFSPPSSPLSSNDSLSSLSGSPNSRKNVKSNSSEENEEKFGETPTKHLSFHDDKNIESSDEIEKRVSASSANNSAVENSESCDSYPLLNMQLSDSSQAFSNNDSQSFCLRGEENEKSQSTEAATNFSKNANLMSPVTLSQMHTEQTKKSRRVLCEEEVFEPASFLLSPREPVKSLRKSKRRCSIRASQALSDCLIRKTRRKSTVLKPTDGVNLPLIPAPIINSIEDHSRTSLLPPLGQSTAKAMSARKRYFSSPRVVTRDDTDVQTYNNTPTLRESTRNKSFSSCYDANTNNTDESNEEECGKTSTLAEVSCHVQRIYSLRKRSRVSTPSFSENENGKSRRPLKKRRRSCKKNETFFETSQDDVLPRRSADEFIDQMPLHSQALCEKSQKSYKRKSKKKIQAVIVLTSLHRNERVAMEKIIRRLGRFCVQTCVNGERASHVICGAARRTMNVLLAISRGLWLLSKEWLIESDLAGQWLDEQKYEIECFPTAKLTRLQRHNSPTWKYSLFGSIEGYVYVARNTKVPAEQLRELIKLCGGHVIDSPRRAAVCVGKTTVIDSSPSVTELWILDSITENVLKPTEDYLIT